MIMAQQPVAAAQMLAKVQVQGYRWQPQSGAIFSIQYTLALLGSRSLEGMRYMGPHHGPCCTTSVQCTLIVIVMDPLGEFTVIS